MKTFILLLLLTIPLSAFSQDELSHFKSLCQSRKAAKVKSISTFIDNETQPYEIKYFDKNGFPEKIEIYTDGNKLYALIENISLNSNNLISYKETFYDVNTNSNNIENIPLTSFIEFGYGDNATISVAYKFDSQNRISEKITTYENYNGNINYIDKLYYDEQNRIQYIKSYDEKSEHIETAYYYYYSANLLTKIRYASTTGSDEYINYLKYTFY